MKFLQIPEQYAIIFGVWQQLSKYSAYRGDITDPMKNSLVCSRDLERGVRSTRLR